MDSPYWRERIKREHKEKMEFNKKEALKQKAKIAHKLHTDNADSANLGGKQ